MAKRAVAARRARGASSGGAHLQQAAHAARAAEAAQRLHRGMKHFRLRSLLGQQRRRAAGRQAGRRVAARQRRLARHRQRGAVVARGASRHCRLGRGARRAPLQRQRAGQLRREATSFGALLSGRGSAARVSATRWVLSKGASRRSVKSRAAPRAGRTSSDASTRKGRSADECIISAGSGAAAAAMGNSLRDERDARVAPAGQRSPACAAPPRSAPGARDTARAPPRAGGARVRCAQEARGRRCGRGDTAPSARARATAGADAQAATLRTGLGAANGVASARPHARAAGTVRRARVSAAEMMSHGQRRRSQRKAPTTHRAAPRHRRRAQPQQRQRQESSALAGKTHHRACPSHLSSDTTRSSGCGARRLHRQRGAAPPAARSGPGAPAAQPRSC